MSDHLSECLTLRDRHDDGLCICPEVRACEARVLDKADGYTEGYADGYVKGQQHERERSVLLIADAYGKALDAAREAVAALAPHLNYRTASGDYASARVDISHVLAAIDALRGAE